MPFDGVHYGDPFDAPAIAAQPAAPLVSDDIVAALVGGYYAGRRNAVRVLEQPFSRRERSAADAGAGLWSFGTTHQEVTSGDVWVDGTFTHAIAVVIAEAIIETDVLLHLRIVATDSAASTKTGSDYTSEPSGDASLIGDASTGALGDSQVLVGGGGLFVHTAELDLSGLTLSDVLLLRVEAYAGAPGVPGVYRPRYASLYLEARA